MTRSGKAREIRIERCFPVSRERVFAAWTNAAEIATWFAAAPFVVVSATWAPGEGAPWRVDFEAPDGSRYWEEGRFLEVASPERLVFSLRQMGLAERGPATVVTVTFEAASAAETRMIFRQTGFGSARSRDDNEEGWEGCLDALLLHLGAGDRP